MLKWIPFSHCKLSYSFKTLMAMWFPTWGPGPIRGPKVIEGIHNKDISSGGGGGHRPKRLEATTLWYASTPQKGCFRMVIVSYLVILFVKQTYWARGVVWWLFFLKLQLSVFLTKSDLWLRNYLSQQKSDLTHCVPRPEMSNKCHNWPNSCADTGPLYWSIVLLTS